MATAHLTDTGNGQRLVERHGTRFRWCETWGCFLVWDGRRWAKEDGGQLVRWAKDTIRALYGEAGDMADETLRKAFYTHALRSENDARLRAMIHLAQSEEGIPIAPEALDRDPWLLNVQNGTLDLRTGEVRAHLPADLITKLAPVEYDPTAAASTWDGFLDRIFAGNRMMMRYVQQAAGYSLTGKTGEQFWLLLHGRGMNGKSTLLRTFVDLLGDYATWTPTTTLLVRRGEGIDNDLARLRGARFVAAVETEGGRRLAEALVKQMTGGDKIAARFLYSEYFEFAPEFKLWLATNHRPEIRGTDWATWRRVRLIPFEVEIPEAEQDKDLLEKLQAEFSGILRWAVDGCLAWQREGLGLPDAVRQATAEYRASMDVVGNFLTECCQDIPHVFSKAGDLYRAYLTWCEDAKEHPESQRRFGEALAERGYTRDRGTAGVKGWRGITLSSDRSDRSDLLSGKFQK
jgi:putative DNA primase/helicase